MPDIEGVPYEAAGTALDVATAQALAARNREAISAGVAAGTEAKALAQSVVADVGTIRTAVVQSANSASAAAGSAAQAEQTATDLVPRMEQIETMAGLAPGEVTDAQTANLVSREDTATRDALNAAIAQFVSDFLSVYTPPVLPEPTYDWAHFGDSMTAAASSGAWVTKFAAFTGNDHHNGGVGGQTAEQIAARWLGPEGAPLRNRHFTFGVGRNGFKETAPEVIVGLIRDMLTHLTVARRGFVLDVPPWVGEESGTENRAKLDTLNTRLEQTFPTYYLPVFAKLRTPEAATAAGITFTAQDQTDISNGLTPASFRSDNGHLNDAGGNAVAYFVRQAATERGYIPEAHALTVADYSRRYVPSMATAPDGTAVTVLRDHAGVEALTGTGFALGTDGNKRYITPAAASSYLRGTVPVPDGNTVIAVIRADGGAMNADVYRGGGRIYRRATNTTWQVSGSTGRINTAAASDGWKIVVSTADATTTTLSFGGDTATGVTEYNPTWGPVLLGYNTPPSAQIAEVIVWSRVLTPTEIAAVRAELAAVYTLT